MNPILFIEELAERLPLKQGLKPVFFLSQVLLPSSLAERLPLKQGLKPKKYALAEEKIELAERLPLKQGLKPKFIFIILPMCGTRRKASIKTRIETYSASRWGI